MPSFLEETPGTSLGIGGVQTSLVHLVISIMGECGGEENRNDGEMLISFPEIQKMLKQKQLWGVGRVWGDN